MSLFRKEARDAALRAEAQIAAEKVLNKQEAAPQPLTRTEAGILIPGAKTLEELQALLNRLGQESVKETLPPGQKAEDFTGIAQANLVGKVLSEWLPKYKQDIQFLVKEKGRSETVRYFANPAVTQMWRDDLWKRLGITSALSIHGKVVDLVEPQLATFIEEAANQ